MTQKEKEQLDAVLDKIERNEDKCWEEAHFMDEHGLQFAKNIVEMKASVYRECFHRFENTISQMKVDEWTTQDEEIANEIIAFFRDGTVILQHDLKIYAEWLEKKVKNLRK